MASPEIRLGLKEAAKAFQVSESTIRRRKKELQAYGARADESGWSIPVSALHAMGWKAREEGSIDTPVEAPTLPDQVAVLELRVQALERDLAVAEAVAAERLDALNVERERVGELQRAITAGPARETPAPEAPARETNAAPAGTLARAAGAAGVSGDGDEPRRRGLGSWLRGLRR